MDGDARAELFDDPHRLVADRSDRGRRSRTWFRWGPPRGLEGQPDELSITRNSRRTGWKTDPALAAVAERTTVFARISPMQKNRIVLALRARGHVVGCLGDGINDAPALRSADVGISVDNAVDVAREAAEIGVLLPFTPLAGWLGFTPLPATFFAFLAAMVATYLALVEVVKAWVYRRQLV